MTNQILDCWPRPLQFTVTASSLENAIDIVQNKLEHIDRGEE
jgi:hypothetical protein